MIDFGDDERFVFYDSLSGLYFSRGYAVESMCWVKECIGNHNCYFGNGYMINELFKLLSVNVSDEYINYILGIANNFKSVGLCNIWVVLAADGIHFSDCIRLVDII